jgi:8-oxo-dGTP diphosphatase
MKPTPVLVATDFVLFGREADNLFVLLIQRLNQPFQHAWALPGGFLDPGEDLASCALRELEEETSVFLNHAEQVGVYDDPNRDPRGRVIAVAFSAIVKKDAVKPVAADDAKCLSWHLLSRLPKLAFDHDQMIREAKSKMLQ